MLAAAHLDAVLDDADDDVVADEGACGHQRLGLLADLGARADGGAAQWRHGADQAVAGRCERGRVVKKRRRGGGAKRWLPQLGLSGNQVVISPEHVTGGELGNAEGILDLRAVGALASAPATTT